MLVTGASGFVGGALLERLSAEAAYEAIGIGRSPSPRADYRHVDLAASTAVADLLALRPFVPDVIVHAAARSSPWGSRSEFERDNVGITRTVLDYAERLAEQHGTDRRYTEGEGQGAGGAGAYPRVVFVSTASVVTRARDQVGAPGDAAARPPFVSRYAETKAGAEELVRAYPGEWTVLRPRAVFGPGDTTLVPRLVAAAESGRLPRIRVPGGRPVLGDLLYIDTLVDQLVTALRSPAVTGATLTLTNGEPVDLQATVLGIIDRLGLPAPRRSVSRRAALVAASAVETLWRVSRRAGEPPITRYSVIVYAFSTTFDDPRAREIFGPPCVTVDEGVDRLVAWLTATDADGPR